MNKWQANVVCISQFVYLSKKMKNKKKLCSVLQRISGNASHLCTQPPVANSVFVVKGR